MCLSSFSRSLHFMIVHVYMKLISHQVLAIIQVFEEYMTNFYEIS